MGKVNRPPPKYKATRRPVPDVRHEREAILARFAKSTTPGESGCIEWTGFKNRLGYGSVSWHSKTWMAHRLMYAVHYGPHDPWLDVRHSCDNPGCVNIEHLSLGTRSDNMRDSVDRRRSKNAKKTHCPRGHPYEEYGASYAIGTYKPWRVCTICQKARYRMRWGWPEHLAFDMSIKVPDGYMMDRETWQIVPVRAKKSAQQH